MCGIAGYYSEKNVFQRSDLQLMANSISHRGPDAEGFFLNNKVGLAHKRLSIIDLSDAANQPFTSQNGRYVLVFNGEIYNFLEIRKELEHSFNIQFKTQSDTETIVEGFAIWGTALFDKLCGMFAMAVFDKNEDTLILCRDRIGIKPLYYYTFNSDIVFSSELKALTSIEKINKSIALNRIAINAYLHLGYIPEPYSVYENINKFPAGHFALIKNGNIQFNKYWEVTNKIFPDTISDEKQAKASLKDLLREIVQQHLICDVPFGTFLSGGVDSSLISAIAQDVSNNPIHTFSIGFEEPKFNESKYAKKVADHLGTIHHEMFVSEKDAINLVPDLIGIYDEPFADSSSLPTYLLSKLTRKHVTMALSGDGGDELFMGYGAYMWAKRLNNPLVSFFRKPMALALSMMGSRYKRVAGMLDYNQQDNLKSHIFSQEQYFFTRKEIQNLINKDFISPILLNENVAYKNRKLMHEEEQSLFDINYYLKDDLLVKVDRSSMQHALEVRVPLLDHRLVEFAVNLAPKLKIKGKTSKYLLKQILYDYVPENFFNRPKRGFAIPLEKWLKKPLKPYVTDMLSEDIVKKHNIVNYKEVNKLIKLFESDNFAFLYNRIWALAILHNFLENKSDKNKKLI